MPITDLWNEPSKPTLSFEFFPVRDEKAHKRLTKAIDKLLALSPSFVSVTFGAGGKTRQGSRELIDYLKNEKGQRVLAYVAGYGLDPKVVGEVIASYRDLGVEDLLIIRGDKPQDDADFAPHPEALPHASDILGQVAASFDVCCGAAAYPEGHVEAASVDADIPFLKKKIENGARFLVANFCFDTERFFEFERKARAAGIDVPILPGIMPIPAVAIVENLANTCGAAIPPSLREQLGALPGDDKNAVMDFGVAFATEQCRQLL